MILDSAGHFFWRAEAQPKSLRGPAKLDQVCAKSQAGIYVAACVITLPSLPGRAVSLRVDWSHSAAANMPETRMNTAFLCRSVSLLICRYLFALGNGMEEVVGSMPNKHPICINFSCDAKNCV